MFNKKSNAEEIGELAIAFIAGAAVGFGVGLLIAPQAGEKTRRKLKRGFDDVSERIRDAVQDEMQQVADGMKDVRSAVNQVMRKVKL